MRLSGRCSALLVLLLVLASACSSSETVDTSALPAGALVEDEAASTAPGSAPDAADPGGATSGAAAAGSASAGDASTPNASTTNASTGGPAASGAPATARLPAGNGVPGVTDEVIKVGMTITDKAAVVAVVSAFSGYDDDGSAAATLGDDRKATQAAIKYVNDTGGIAGRRVEAVYTTINTADNTTPTGRQRATQAACAELTEDNSVFAITGFDGMSDDGWVDCAVRARSPLIASLPGLASYVSERRSQEVADYWYAPMGFVADRRERAVVETLAGQGFFDDEAKVGVFVDSKPDIREGVERGLLPALAKIGIKPTRVIEHPDSTEAPWANYMLQLKTEGVTHVLFAASSSAFGPFYFATKAAEDQNYRPRWGIGTDQSPLIVSGLGAPEAQMQNTMGVGWLPGLDVATELPPQSDRAEECDDAMKAAGSPGVAGYIACEHLFFLRDALAIAPELSATGLRAGAEQLGDTHRGVLPIEGGERFAPGRHDGITNVRLLGWIGECGCFEYTTGAIRLRD